MDGIWLSACSSIVRKNVKKKRGETLRIEDYLPLSFALYCTLTLSPSHSFTSWQPDPLARMRLVMIRVVLLRDLTRD